MNCKNCKELLTNEEKLKNKKLKQNEYNKKWRTKNREKFNLILKEFYKNNIKNNDEYKKYKNDKCKELREKKKTKFIITRY
jgi:hypothetical protein